MEEEFEKADSGAAHSEPVAGGSLKIGSHVILKNFPCKVQ